MGNRAAWALQSGPGDNLYTSSVLALRPKTGEIAWHYQFTPNDAYDYDACWELILADIDVGGQKRKVMMQLNRNGFLYVLDRTNGGLISAKPFETANLASQVNPASRPPGGTRAGEEAARRRADRAVAAHPRRQELAACCVQPADRPPLRQHHASRRHLQAPADQGVRGRPALPVHREPAGPDCSRRGHRPRGGD